MKEKLQRLRQLLANEFAGCELPQPRIIHVETRSKCNGTCRFCPASLPDREDLTMPMELIEKAIAELAEWDYCGRLSFYNNNEPFLDRRLAEIVAHARQRLPKAYLELKTNGKALTLEQLCRVFNAGIDQLYLNDYSDDGNHHANVIKLKQELSRIRRFKGHFADNNYQYRIIISKPGVQEIKGTRAGNSPNRERLTRICVTPCFRPFEMMTISPEGKVALCSEDFYYTLSQGDFSHQSLREIWGSKSWNQARKELLAGNRKCNALCVLCDYKGCTFEMLKEHNLFAPGEHIPYDYKFLRFEGD